MQRTTEQLEQDALAIWKAGVKTVHAGELIRNAVSFKADTLWIEGTSYDLKKIQRVFVVGAGKASGAMAASLENVFGEKRMEQFQFAGVVSVPAGEVRPLKNIKLRAGRPDGVNQPTSEGVEIADEMLAAVSQLKPSDLCIALITGGGSALLPAPIEGVSLEEKQWLTEKLAASGANIQELNIVRTQLSRIKGGKLSAACNAGQLVTLILSDVPGDSLELIASGPTVATTSTANDALGVLEKYSLSDVPQILGAVRYLRKQAKSGVNTLPINQKVQGTSHSITQVQHFLLGNNALAVDAAGLEAVKRGYRPAMLSADKPEGLVENIASHLATMALQMRDSEGPDCLISGGEPTVELVSASQRGRGGRNQQLVLAAGTQLKNKKGIVLLSGGTDGEDGPTDAAGAYWSEAVASRVTDKTLDAKTFLANNDAYTFFEKASGLVKTGYTQTNVCDLRVVVVEQRGS